MAGDYCRLCRGRFQGSFDCCTSPFTNYPGFLITLSDVNRIVKNTAYKIEDFAKIIFISDEDMGSNKNDSYFKDMMFDNKFLYLYGAGKCPFKGKDGCKIYKHRPMMCRIHPFWFKKEKKGFEIIVEWGTSAKDEKCLICKKHFKSEDYDFLLGLIDETRDSMLKTIKQFNDEIEVHKRLKHKLADKSVSKVISEDF